MSIAHSSSLRGNSKQEFASLKMKRMDGDGDRSLSWLFSMMLPVRIGERRREKETVAFIGWNEEH